MKLTNRQAHYLLVILQDTLKMDIAGYLSISHENRFKMLQEIINQQTNEEVCELAVK